MIKFFHNSKTGEIGSYEETPDGCYGIKGQLYAYGDALTTGFNTLKEAKTFANKWGYCPKCDGASAFSERTNGCFKCGSKLEFKEIKII